MTATVTIKNIGPYPVNVIKSNRMVPRIAWTETPSHIAALRIIFRRLKVLLNFLFLAKRSNAGITDIRIQAVFAIM